MKVADKQFTKKANDSSMTTQRWRGSWTPSIPTRGLRRVAHADSSFLKGRCWAEFPSPDNETSQGVWNQAK